MSVAATAAPSLDRTVDRRVYAPFAVKACHGRDPDPRCRARNNRQVRTGFGEWPVFPYKHPREVPGSAGFQPARTITGLRRIVH